MTDDRDASEQQGQPKFLTRETILRHFDFTVELEGHPPVEFSGLSIAAIENILKFRDDIPGREYTAAVLAKTAYGDIWTQRAFEQLSDADLAFYASRYAEHKAGLDTPISNDDPFGEFVAACNKYIEELSARAAAAMKAFSASLNAQFSWLEDLQRIPSAIAGLSQSPLSDWSKLSSNLLLAHENAFSFRPTLVSIADSINELRLDRIASQHAFATGARLADLSRSMLASTYDWPRALSRQNELFLTKYESMIGQLARYSRFEELASSAMSAATSIVDSYVSQHEFLTVIDDNNTTVEVIDPNAFDSIMVEVELSAASNIVDDSTFIKSTALEVTTIALEIVQLMYEIMELNGELGEEQIFSTTPKVFQIGGTLAAFHATTREEFMIVAERTYILLYESSAGMSRVTERGVAYPKVMDVIKHLRRNRAHDIQHGSLQDRRKKAREVGDHLASLVGTSTPSSASEWLYAQRQLFARIREFLLDLRNHLIKPGPYFDA